MSDWASAWVSPDNTGWVKPGTPIIKPEPIELEIFVPVKVQGEAIGDLMVYGWQGEWYIAHIPTETRFDNGVPEGDWTKKQLILWCAKVQKHEIAHWKELATATYETYANDTFYESKEFLKQYCLSIKVE